LAKRVAALEKQVAALLADNQRLREQLAASKKDSSTSSKPPSSDIVKPGSSESGSKRGRGKRRIGGQPGHRRNLRTPFSPEEIDHSWEYFHEACPDCGGKLQNSRQADRVIQQVELVERPFVVSEHCARTQWCPCCQKVYRAPLPLEVLRAGLVGPRMTALVGYLKGVCHVSYEKLREFFGDVLNLPISTGQLAKLTRKMAMALDRAYEELREALPSEAQVGTDETGHKENGRKMWTWCFQTPSVDGFTFFAIDSSRGSQVLEAVLGNQFSGTLSCDFFSAYRKFQHTASPSLQYCWAHLIRDVRFLTTLSDKVTKNYGERVLKEIERLFHDWHRRGDVSRSAANKRLAKRRVKLLAIAKRAPPRKEAQNIAERFRHYKDEYFRFLDDWSIEPTNNGRERALRHAVIDRKITQGTRSCNGRRWCERIWTALATCRQQNRSPFKYLAQNLTAHYSDRLPPSLLCENP
jgi:transposase